MFNYSASNFSISTDPGSSNCGMYELQAVLTHQGRSSSSGHYLAWVKHSGNVWLKLDDDKVSMVLEEDVLKLSGGGEFTVQPDPPINPVFYYSEHTLAPKGTICHVLWDESFCIVSK